MTSGRFQSYPIASIITNRADRQRRELVNIDELAESIARTGLIHPIVVTSDGVLVAGERRLTACRSLGWTSIPVQFAEDLSEYELQVIELEENIKRVDLTWQDECLAMERFHRLKASNEDNWSQIKTAEALGVTDSTVAQKLAVAKEILSGNERIATADKFSVAKNLTQRSNERKKATTLEGLSSALFEEPSQEEKSLVRPVPILLADFHRWQEDYSGPKFNLIHCDFPYGINVADSPRQNSSIQEYYDDSPEVYHQLLGTLMKSMENVVAESAHLIFWFSMHYYEHTLKCLTEMGWTVNPFPLVWHKSDNAGVAPDPQRWPRRTYETAFVASRGDRKLTQAGSKSNSFAYPGKLGDEAHLSAKPREMLRHFLSMFCDEYSLVFDPTCGSGNALRVAEDLGAKLVLGLEKNEDFYTTAVARYYE